MARVLLILAFVAVIFWVFSIVDCAVQPPERHRGVRKGMWIAIVIVFPVIGGALWFGIGRTGAGAARTVAPDDDPDFLRGLGGTAARSHPNRGSRAEQDERIRQLEQELSRLDSDDEDPPARPHRGR